MGPGRNKKGSNADRSATWRSIREDLEGLPTADWNKNWSLLPPVVDGKQLHSQWVWFDPTDPSLCARADAILLKAATARGYNSEDQLLDELRFADFVRFKSSGDAPARLADGTAVAVPSGLLKDVVKHLITLCHQLEAGDVPKPIITRLPREAAARIDAAMAAFWRKFSLRLRQAPELRDTQRRRLQQATFLSKLVTKTFELMAHEYMQVCSSVNEFEVELRSGLARHIEVSVGLHLPPGSPMLIELNDGLSFFRAEKNPWAAISQTKRRSRWHIGALTAAALAHAARRMTAEATARAADGPADTNPNGRELADQGKIAQAYIGEVWRAKGQRITGADIWRAAGYKTRATYERWLRGRSKPESAPDRAFRRIIETEKPHLK
jgi:hypothetical protein